MIPGITTAVRQTQVTGKWYLSIYGIIGLLICVITWSPILTIMYILYVVIVNCLYVRVMFPNSNPYLSPFGLYKVYLEVKEVVTCLSKSKEK